MSARDDTVTVEHRLNRIEAIMVAMQAVGDNALVPAQEGTCQLLQIMGAEEMAKVMAALDRDVFDRLC